ncbi:MAG: polysaccharide deacetylase family protein [Nitrospirae bacterium]|nr:polysaccharide deacetylase family protein [Nitrospirota bacterium]
MEKVRRIPVLLYHKIGHPPEGVQTPRTYVTPGQFRWQMKFLHRWGYRTLSPEELVRHYEGTQPVAGRRVLITFDDGSETCYTTAWPILSEFSFTALLFLVAGPFENRDAVLTKSQVGEMMRHGFTMGAHSLSHARFTDLSLADVRREITESKSRLENDLRSPIDYFAYPYGAYRPEHLALVRQAGYRAGFTTHHPEGGLLAIRRENIHLKVKPLRFLWRFYRASRGSFAR